MTTMIERHTETTTASRSLTVEHLLYAGIVAVAAILRLPDLGRLPLSPAEASEALAVWQAGQPARELLLPTSPAYFSLTSAFTQIAGYSDGVMRLVPAVAGLVLVILPFGLRPFIGRLAALVSSFLLAISPLLVWSSRTATGQSLALMLGLLLFICGVHYRHTEDVRWLYALAATLGLGLTTAPVFYTMLTALALAWWITRPRQTPAEIDKSSETSVPKTVRTAVWVGAGVLLAASTALLWRFDGLGATVNLATAWLSQLPPPDDILLWIEPFLTLMRYEVSLLPLTILGAVALLQYRGTSIAWVVGWYTATLGLLLLNVGGTTVALSLTVPGYLLIGLMVEQIERPPATPQDGDAGWWRWPLMGLLVALVLVIATHLGRYARIHTFNPTDTTYLTLVLVGVLVGIMAIAAALAWERRTALQALVWPVLLILTLLNWNTAWRLGQVAPNDPRERWITEGTDDDVQLLVEMVEEIARETRGADTAATIFSLVDQPALRWYLRDFSVTYGAAVPATLTPDLIITPQAENDPVFNSDYLGTDFGVYRPPTDHPLSPTEMLRWWFYYQSPHTIDEERVILWVRADLVQGRE